MITLLKLTAFSVFLHLTLSQSSSQFFCDQNNKNQENKCKTFAILRANSRFSSISNLTNYLNITRSKLSEANNFSPDIELFSNDRPVLIPLDCKCNNDGFFEADIRKPIIKGESFFEIAQSLNGLTTSKAIKEKNPNLEEKSNLLIPLKCACPYEPAAITHFQNTPKRGKKPRIHMLGVYISVPIIAILVCIAILAAIFFFHRKKMTENIKGRPNKNGADLETQQLGLSIRTTSDNKVSFEGSQYNFDEPTTTDNYTTATPHKAALIENYAFEDLQKSTEDFSSSNLIEGSVFHGRLKGKNLAIKRVKSELISKVDHQVFDEKSQRHINMIRLLGTCLTDGPDSFVVLEYAKNGSLKDWVHGGLAIKSHFIESCSCFLTWDQRLRICLDVATALQYMHHVMSPRYVHRNIKSRNIFLDEDFSAKVGNLGLPRCIKEPETDEKEESQGQICNKGYLAPEYLAQGTISPSIDVFAYGVVLLEVLSGKPPIRRDEEGKNGTFVKLSDEIKRVLVSDGADELRGWIDGALGENYSFDAAVMLANLAKLCVDDDSSLRPNAGEIVEKLLRLVEDSPETDDQFSVCESSCKPLVKISAKEI